MEGRRKKEARGGMTFQTGCRVFWRSIYRGGEGYGEELAGTTVSLSMLYSGSSGPGPRGGTFHPAMDTGATHTGGLSGGVTRGYGRSFWRF
jgi:hypothetical protein